MYRRRIKQIMDGVLRNQITLDYRIEWTLHQVEQHRWTKLEEFRQRLELNEKNLAEIQKEIAELKAGVVKLEAGIKARRKTNEQ